MKTTTALIFGLALVLSFGGDNAWSQTLPIAPFASAPGDLAANYPPQITQTSYCDECGDASGGCECEQDSGLLGGLLQGDGGGGCCNGFWGDVEYLFWWGKERYVPALVTTSVPGTLEAQAGRLGLFSTTILFGDEMIGHDPESGFRITGGTWLDRQHTFGIGGRYFSISGEEDFSQTSDLAGSPILARPFFNTALNVDDALLVAFPGISHGNINVSAENEVRGFDIMVRRLLHSGNCNRFDLVGGYQNSRIEDTVQINNRLISDDPARLPLGSTIDTQDHFEVRNQFDGGFVGLMATAEDGRLSWRMLAKIAFGNMNQEARISGSTVSAITGPGGVVTSTSDFGLLALPSNIGTMEQDEFAMIPELNINVAYNATSCLQFTLGYSFIHWTEVALAGDMIDTTINPTQMLGPLVGASRPTATMTSDNFWYTGLSFGGTLKY